MRPVPPAARTGHACPRPDCTPSCRDAGPGRDACALPRVPASVSRLEAHSGSGSIVLECVLMRGGVVGNYKVCWLPDLMGGSLIRSGLSVSFRMRSASSPPRNVMVSRGGVCLSFVAIITLLPGSNPSAACRGLFPCRARSRAALGFRWVIGSELTQPLGFHVSTFQG